MVYIWIAKVKSLQAEIVREEFKFTGLSNCSFVESEFWKVKEYGDSET